MVRQWRESVGARVTGRRAVLQLVGGAVSGAILAACGGEAAPMTGAGVTAVASPPRPATNAATAAGTAAPGSGATAPATMAAAPPVAAGATPTRLAVAMSDIVPSGVPGVPDIYLKPPAPFKSVDAVPGRGGKVTAFLINYAPPVPARSENRYWQELEKRLGVTYDVNLVPSASYEEKLAAVTASGDLPDLVWLSPPADQLRVIQQGGYTDLTPYLTGDALKEHANLAAYPPQLWKNVAIRGKIYGVPRAGTSLVGGALFFRQDWAEKVGPARPKNADEFLDLMTKFTQNDPDGNGRADSYGLGASGAGSILSLQFFMEMFRVPNAWRQNADGSLTYHIETDEFKGAIAYMRRLFEAGVYHPDAAAMTLQAAKDGFAAGKFGAYYDGLGAIGGSSGLRFKAKQVTPAARSDGMVTPGFDGGKPVTHIGSGYFGFTAIPSRVGRMGAERVRELLRILNYLAAPNFSEEFNFINAGLEGVHHTLIPDGRRVVNDLLTKEKGDLNKLVTPPQVISYNPDYPEDVSVPSSV